MDYFDIMNSACTDVDIEFTEKKYNDFIKYKELIQDWNNKINLTAITEDEQIIKKHFIDCIKIFKANPIKNARKILDVGTGAGFPGLPIKIVKEDMNIVLLDSLQKRVRFLNEVINKTNLDNIEAIHGRAEELGKDKNHRENYDVVVSRAVANLAVLSEFTIPFVKKGGYFIAMKGPAVEEEIENARKAIKVLGGKIEDIIEVNVEETDLKHNLVIIKKIKSTPGKYPRKSGMVKKEPIK